MYDNEKKYVHINTLLVFNQSTYAFIIRLPTEYVTF